MYICRYDVYIYIYIYIYIARAAAGVAGRADQGVPPGGRLALAPQ